MRIMTWNVNGLRAIVRKDKFTELFDRYDPDIVCFQEIKAEKEQLPQYIQSYNGYEAYFSSSTTKKGYSGVAVYTKETPKEVSAGIEAEDPDDEGRVLEIRYTTPFPFTLFSVYFPNGGGGPERLQYKLDFYDRFLAHMEARRAAGESIILCGDVNTAHNEIDLARPKPNETNTGFLPEERAWIDQVVAAGYIDVFRHFYPEKTDQYTYWDMKTRARDRNVGWRIDYFFVSPDLIGKVEHVSHETEQFGSDHCPVLIDIEE